MPRYWLWPSFYSSLLESHSFLSLEQLYMFCTSSQKLVLCWNVFPLSENLSENSHEIFRTAQAKNHGLPVVINILGRSSNTRQCERVVEKLSRKYHTRALVGLLWKSNTINTFMKKILANGNEISCFTCALYYLQGMVKISPELVQCGL